MRREGLRWKWGWLLALTLLVGTGCGTTRVTDTSRTGTEQLLISHSVDQAISEMDFSALAGKKVFFEEKYMDGVTDKGYVISSLRQHLLAHGALLKEKKEDAAYVVEARSGAVGTDRTDLLYGIPQMSVPTIIPGQPGGPFPEVPIAKRTNRKGVAKIAVFAYNKDSGTPVWQSGVVMKNSTANDSWVMGAGPFADGTVVSGTKTNGQVVQVPLHEGDATPQREGKVVSVTQAAAWQEGPQPLQATPLPGVLDPNVQQAGNKQKP